MPYAIETYESGRPHLHLGSDMHHAKLGIVVNSKTGEHKSLHPIPIKKAKAQMRLLEAIAHKEKL